MKKLYSKPEIAYEDFTPSTSIAAGCEKIANMSENSCGILLPDMGFSIFLEGVGACKDYPIADGSEKLDGVCYHNPYGENNVFNS